MAVRLGTVGMGEAVAGAVGSGVSLGGGVNVSVSEMPIVADGGAVNVSGAAVALTLHALSMTLKTRITFWILMRMSQL